MSPNVNMGTLNKLLRLRRLDTSYWLGEALIPSYYWPSADCSSYQSIMLAVIIF